MNAILIFNEKGGTFLNQTDGLTRESLREAIEAAGLHVTMRPAAGTDIEKSLKQSIAEKPDVLLVGGGDGTVSAAAGLLVDTPLPLGVVPLGTLNHFARDLGFPTEWRKAVVALRSAEIKRVDVAEVNGRVFINNCSVGAYAEAVRRRDALRRERGHGKWPAMIIASFAVFRELRRLSLRFEFGGSSSIIRTPFLLVGNNRYTGQVLDASLRPRLDEGKLWFYTTRARTHLTMLRMVWQSLINRIDAADELEVRAVPDAVISTNRRMLPVAADGEIIDVKPPLHFRSRPKSLNVLVPQTQTPE
jgi:diacylglycerol kinase family enzyme